MNRLYMAEPAFTPTGSVADERVNVTPAVVLELLRGLHGLVVDRQGLDDTGSHHHRWLRLLQDDLVAHRGASVVAVGPSMPAEAHAMAAAINEQLGNVGTTVSYVADPVAEAAKPRAAMGELVERMAAGAVDTLIILGGNPVFDAPTPLNFAAALAAVPHSVHLSLYDNETSELCEWHLPRAHALESWGDGLGWDGTYTLQQPTILPLYGGVTPSELLAKLAAMPDASSPKAAPQRRRESGGAGYDLVRETYFDRFGRDEAAWRTALSDGMVEGSQSSESPRRDGVGVGGVGVGAVTSGKPQAAADGFTIVFRPHANLYDGRYANNGWLLEAPEPMTKVTWDNPALISIHDGLAMGLEQGDHVSVKVGDRAVEMPVFMMPGVARGVVVVTLGHGRTRAGRVGGYVAGKEKLTVGVDTYPIRPLDSDVAEGAVVRRTGGHTPLAVTQNHHLLVPIDDVAEYGIEKRIGKKHHSGSQVKEATLAEYQHNPSFATEGAHGDVSLQLFQPPSVLPGRDETFGGPFGDDEQYDQKRPGGPWYFNEPHAWGMTIDLNSCVGCNGCVVACQAENNIPVVGKDEVLVSREMHWLRIDTYYKGDPQQDESPDVVHMPVMCVHCENAPCEQVCPVAATVHDTEGLNTMVYNRCIGTRYCSNNCPYKVRRFQLPGLPREGVRPAA